MKRFLFAVAVAASLLPRSVTAAEPDALCYVRTATGRVIDLSASVCQMQNRGDGNDIAFISDYRMLVSQQKNPMIRQVLLDQVKQNPQGKIGLAKSTCEVLQTGATMDRVRSLQVETIPSRSENPDLHDAQITSLAAINTVGVRHYCPQFASR